MIVAPPLITLQALEDVCSMGHGQGMLGHKKRQENISTYRNIARLSNIKKLTPYKLIANSYGMAWPRLIPGLSRYSNVK